jgi:type VI secretion system protein ImpA
VPNSFLESLRPPISEDNPCGPDLDLEGDPDFMNFLAGAEGILPSTFFVDQGEDGFRPLDRSDVNFREPIAAGLGLLKRTLDLRILGFLAVFAALERRLEDLIDIFEATAVLLGEQWDQINPREQGDQFALRMAALDRLDDNLIFFPLQFTTLIRHPRLGALNYRQKLLADGAPAKPGEDVGDPADYADAYTKVPLNELIALRDRIARFAAAFDSVTKLTSERLGARFGFKSRRVQPLVVGLLSFLEAAVVYRDPGASTAPPGPAPEEIDTTSNAPAKPSTPPGAMDTSGAAAAALAGVIGYFERSEPSNPALLLLKQAQRLIGKDFLEVMRILAPEHYDQAVFGIGRTHFLDLPMPRLGDQFSVGEGDGSLTPEIEPLAVADRSAALAILQQIEAFYARNEPSSPIPFLCERARKLCSSDFLTILRQILPEDALKTGV